MRINLMDPALRWAAGHHLDLNIGVAKELRSAGHDVHVYAHVDISPDARKRMAAHAELSALFQASPYDDSMPADGVAGGFITFIHAAKQLAADLQSVRTADRWIWPSLFASQHYANVIASPGIPVSGCVLVEPTYLNPLGRALWHFSFDAAQKKGVQIHAGAFDSSLCNQYLPLAVSGRFGKLPVPYDTIHEPVHKKELATVGFFGSQRDEKGVTLIAKLIPMLLERGFKIVLHDSSGNSTGTGNSRLRVVLGYVEDLAAEIITCDLVVTPYDPAQYRTKGSAIVWSALANGIPVIAPDATASGDLVVASGAGKVFTAFTAASVFQSILDARDDQANICTAARAVSRNWMSQHGLRKFVDAMLQVD